MISPGMGFAVPNVSLLGSRWAQQGTANTQRLRHEFDMGGGGSEIGTLGGRRRHDMTHLPQFPFLLEFRPLYFAKRHANVFILKKMLKNKNIAKHWRGLSRRPQDWGGGHVPRVPTHGAAYANTKGIGLAGLDRAPWA